MTMRNFLTPSLCSLLVACALLKVPAMSQETTTPSQGQNENTVEGTVVSSTRDTLVVKTDDNQFQLFTFDHDTVKPRSLPAGTRVRSLDGRRGSWGTACEHHHHVRGSTECE